jgi:transcriptional regulator with XRE-family HTH domain
MWQHLGANLRFHRRLQGLTQAALADLAGAPFTQGYISRLERGITPSRPDHVPQLATTLRVPVAALLRKPRVVRTAAQAGPVVVVCTARAAEVGL